MDINWIVDSPFDSLPVGSPENTAFSIDGAQSWTYAELRERRNQYIDLLRRDGVVHGDRVGVLLLNSFEYVALYFAITRLGAIAVRLNFRLTPEELVYILSDSGCRSVWLHTSRIAQVASTRDRVEVESWRGVVDNAEHIPSWVQPVDIGGASTEDVDLPRPAEEDPLVLMYTSGTTGRPKGVVWTHKSSLWLAASQALKWSYTNKTVAMTTGPLYHAGAFELLLLPALFVGGTAVCMSSGGMTNDRIVSTIREQSVTHVLLYPFLLYGVLKDQTLTRDHLPSLRAIVVGGDPVQAWALEAVDQKFPGIEIWQGYGLTEAPQSTCLDHEHRLAHSDSVGRPMPLVRVRTMLDETTPALVGEVGEVWIQSPAAATGYWNNPVATAATFVDGWCRTGDLGVISADGFLSITGRAKDMIRSGGENIYPAEVETALIAHESVEAIAVVAVPDARFVETGCAIVVRSSVGETHSDEELERLLRTFARSTLAGYKCPKHYVFVDALPVNAAGKVLKQQMRTQYASLGS